MTRFARRLMDACLKAVTPSRYERAPFIRLTLETDRRPGGGEDDVGVLRALLRHGHGGFGEDDARRLGYWPGQEHRPHFEHAWKEQDPEALERPWNFRWDRLQKRSAGPGFSRGDYRAARERAREVARTTLGPEGWESLHEQGFLDLPSKLYPGVIYRMRVGRRIQVICEPGVEPPWCYDFLCINPAYPLPEYEFFAQLYLYVRDDEEEVVRVAAPQPWDQALGRTF